MCHDCLYLALYKKQRPNVVCGQKSRFTHATPLIKIRCASFDEISHVWGFGQLKNIIIQFVIQSFSLSNKASPFVFVVDDHQD